MADYTITPANVAATSGKEPLGGIAGEALEQGQAFYTDKSDGGKWKLADANDPDASVVKGIVLNSAEPGQPVSGIALDDDFAPGMNMAVGDIPVLSATPGGIAPSSDLATGMYPVTFGIATSATKMVLKITRGTVVIP